MQLYRTFPLRGRQFASKMDVFASRLRKRVLVPWVAPGADGLRPKWWGVFSDTPLPALSEKGSYGSI